MLQKRKVRKAVIAAAGFGTRFLPQTKAMPKEMLPLVDKPIIQHIVEQLVEAGIEDIILVTGYHKRSIEDHFDQMSAELRANLKAGGKTELLEATKRISNLANFIYVRQKGILGNATPLLNTEHLVGDEPFIYAFADDFIESYPCRFTQMIDKFYETGDSVISCMEVTKDEDYDMYGVVSGQEVEEGLIKMDGIVEKPGKANAPSNLASVSAYLFDPKFFKYLNQSLKNVPDGKEFMIQPAMCDMIADKNIIYALKIKNGKYYDTGDKLEYLKTVVDFGLKDPTIKDGLLEHLRKVV